jgi:hypothetical protein
MGSNGDGIRNIVALDNIAITTAVDNSDAEEDEPEADFKEVSLEHNLKYYTVGCVA